MMKKTIKKLLAALLAVAMVCAMAIPAFAYDTEEVRAHHSFEAFQIFKGDVSDDNTKISNVKWGKNITNSTDFLEKLTADSTIGGEFNNPTTPQDVLAVISKWHDSDNNSIAFARFVCHYLYSGAVDPGTSIPSSGDVVEIPINEAGYYLIVDTTDFRPGDSYHAYNSFLLNVTKAPFNLLIKPKFVKPTVEKKVYDNQDGTSNTEGFDSSADHAINEKFKFQLIAKLPASSDRAYDYYDKYTVCFNDTLSAGITFDNLDTVEIANVDGSDSKEITNYKFDDTDLHEAGHPTSFKLSIDDVKTCAAAAGLNLNDGATITVTYTAHLNDKATVNTANGSKTTDNKNSVFLQYSNNPRIDTSLDHTTTSEVCVYTYQLNNTKHQDSENGPVLEGAGFRLYSNEACNAEDEIKLKMNDDGTYSRDFSTEGKGVEMLSNKDGQFNVKGLDAGTYYLKETNPPAGYGACANKEIVISATHDVNHVDLSGNLSTTIINKKAGGITLPSTGGIGTTIFYVVGGGLMVAAIVLLVTKKRMENK
jgi:fimbrial isopeptide formation D2 family protein/LPXTG-motif cell wall-anchored protein